MPERAALSRPEVVALLETVAGDLDVPDGARLPAGVRARLVAAPPPVRGRAARPAVRAGWARVAVALAVAMAVVVAAAALSPSTRRAVADWLGIGAVEIQYGDGPPAATVSQLDLGRRVGLEEASRLAGFPVRRPRALDEPAGVYVRRLGAGVHEVTLVWPPDERLPRTAETGVGLLVTQLPAEIHPVYVKKLAGPETLLRAVEVNGAPGYWVAGNPHGLLYRAPDGTEFGSETRLAGNVLLWSRDGVTYRLESALGLAEARRLAESLR